MPTSALLVLVLSLYGVLAAPGTPHDEHPAVDFVVDIAGVPRDTLDALRYDADSTPAVPQAPIVTLPNLGMLSGSTGTSTKNQRTFYQYMGVPFAKAPLDTLRFKEPQPAEAWSGTLDASKPGKVCIQMRSSVATASARELRLQKVAVTAEDQSEDCLVLNVFTPNVSSLAKLPVLFFVHGGAFVAGSARDLPPNNLMDYDVILVTPQYRLGALGFLNLQVDDVPGNAGLLDVVEALKWVQANIEYFGGDPQKVTLAGQSAGAAIASLLSLSSLTNGLMRAVMSMSGSALTFWSWDRNPEVASAAIAKTVHCDASGDAAKRVSCLQQVAVGDLSTAYLQVAASTLFQGLGPGISGGGPSIQKAGKTRVLTDLPENILQSKNYITLPLLTGVVKHEGTYALELAELGYINPHRYNTDSSFLRNDLVPVLLKMLNVDDPAGFVADSTTGFFFDPSSLGDFAAMQDGLIDFTGAFGFKSGVRQHALLHSTSGANTFLYSFSHDGPDTNTPLGIYHGADLIYLFPTSNADFSPNDVEMGNIMLNYVTNFVTYLNPTPSNVPSVPNLPPWKPFARDDENYMLLDVPCTLRQNFRQELTVARMEHFNEHGSTPPSDHPTSTALPTAPPSSASTRQDSPATDSALGTAPSALATLLLATAVVFTAMR